MNNDNRDDHVHDDQGRAYVENPEEKNKELKYSDLNNVSCF